MDQKQFIKIGKIFFIILFLTILIISIYPGNLIGLLIKGDPTTYPGGDKISHFIAYFVLSVFGYYFYQDKFKISLIFIFLIIFSISMELLHLIIPNRFYENFDLMMNCLGVISPLIFLRRF